MVGGYGCTEREKEREGDSRGRQGVVDWSFITTLTSSVTSGRRYDFMLRVPPILLLTILFVILPPLPVCLRRHCAILKVPHPLLPQKIGNRQTDVCKWTCCPPLGEAADGLFRVAQQPKHIQKNLPDVKLKSLAIAFEISGRFIKNSVFPALAQVLSDVLRELEAATAKLSADTKPVPALAPDDVVLRMPCCEP